MTNILISTIRFGAVTALAFSLFIGEAFAAPVLTPVSVSAISETTATFTVKVANPGYKVTTVWFEWGDTQNLGNTIGMQDVFSEGYSTGYAYDLKPGNTYYVRAVAMEGGASVYSSLFSFKTRGGVTAIVVEPLATINQTSSTIVAPVTTTTTQTETKKTVASATVATTTAKNINTNNNLAAVSGAGEGTLPQTLIGWVSLFIALIIVLVVGMIIFESIEERKKMREDAKKKKRTTEEEEEKSRM